jgi:para-nitrobenzyl esterase
MPTLFKRERFSRWRKDIAALRPATISIALGLALAAGPLTSSANTGGSPIVRTDSGPVQGFQTEGITEFLGIPYAAPPVGNLRWRPPTSPPHWTNVKQATSFGSNCPQNNELGVYAGPVNTTDEDCLFVNVFTPAIGKNGKLNGQKLAVMFWIHGGGNVDGESTDYDGSRLAVDGHTVVVTINYRLGTLGWLASPALDAEGHLFGNYGMLDQLFALKWVQRNIANFGGDPTKIAMGGQSEGSYATEANVISALFKGQFNRAIFESGNQEPQTLAAAEVSGNTFQTSAGCTATPPANPANAACLRALTVAQILALPAHSTYTGDGQTLPLQYGVGYPVPGAPSSDYLPISNSNPGVFYTDFNTGSALYGTLPYTPCTNCTTTATWDGSYKGTIPHPYNHMPIMSGSVEDEENFFLAATEYTTQAPYSAANFAAAIAAFPTTSNSFTAPLTIQQYVAAHYPLISPNPPGPQLSIDPLATANSGNGRCFMRFTDEAIATGHSPSPVYTYVFEDRTAPFYFPPFPFPFKSLAYHTSDQQYLWGNLSHTVNFHGGPSPPSVIIPLNRQQSTLADQLVAAWTNLAWTGNPNGVGNFPWPRYLGSARNSYHLLENIFPAGLSRQTDAQFAAENNCGFWDSYQTH